MIMDGNRYKLIRLIVLCTTFYITTVSVVVLQNPDSLMRVYYSITNIVNHLTHGAPVSAPC